LINSFQITCEKTKRRPVNFISDHAIRTWSLIGGHLKPLNIPDSMLTFVNELNILKG